MRQDNLKPVARFDSLANAVSSVSRGSRADHRIRAINHPNRLPGHFAPHSVLGQLDGYQWLCGNARHVENHAAHMVEIRAMAEFPKD